MPRTLRLAPFALLAILIPFLLVACSGSSNSNAQTATASATRTSATATATATTVPGRGPSTSNSQANPSAVSVAASVVPSVVRVGINCSNNDPANCAATGSGWLFDTSGHFVTNAHVVTLEGRISSPSNIILTTSVGVNMNATLVGSDSRTDLAVVQAKPPSSMKPLSLGDTAAAQIGEPVVAIGYALDLGTTPSVTTGVISAKERQIAEATTTIYGLFQTDAAINPGNSGGPLVDYNGNVLGVNTAGASGAQGIGFAISSRTVTPVVQQLLQHGSVQRGFIGIGFQDVSPGLAQQENLPVQQGVQVQQVQPGSPADRAGIKAGDVIVKIGNTDITQSSDVPISLIGQPAGTKLDVTYYRGSQKSTVSITLDPSPQP